MDSYTRTIRFSRIGLHTQVPDLTVTVRVETSGGHSYVSGSTLDTQIARYARQFLAHDGDVIADAHPDRRTGAIHGKQGDKRILLGEFTVHPEGEELPAPGVDLADITAIAEVAVYEPKRVHSVVRCRTGALVRVHGDYTHKTAKVLAETGYTTRIVEGVVLVSLNARVEREDDSPLWPNTKTP
ncbi:MULTISPECIES: hypothetical protein [unclassified Nocardiopsis]|uniref:hypothetical protein n=1 Tax=Nocardiopsis TaxID=2013 RepID=UPI00387AB27B